VKKAYHCIPILWYDAAKAYSARKGKPIDPLVGRMLERYLLAGNIGEGGMGSVYVAIQKPLFREVALKLIGDLDLNRHSVGRFEREARAVSALDHPNIVKIHDYGVGELDKKIPYMALEYLRHGRTLRKAFTSLNTAGKVDGALVLLIFRQILNALGAAHAVGIVHRDVKPENVMIVPVHGDPNLVKVLDFGLARMDSDESSFEGDSIAAGRLAGTPYYMAPEQIPRKGVSGEIDGRADLYAVGVMLYEIMTGTRPFDGDSALAVLARKLDPSFDAMGLPATKVLSKGVRGFLTKALAMAPDERYSTASEMLLALEHVFEPRSQAMGLVVIGSQSSSDRIEAPAEVAAGRTPANQSPLAPTPRTPAQAAAPLSGISFQHDRSQQAGAGFRPGSGSAFGGAEGGLEVDLPHHNPPTHTGSSAEPPRGAAGTLQTAGTDTPGNRPLNAAARQKQSIYQDRQTGVAPAARRSRFSTTTILIAAVALSAALALAPWVATQMRVASAQKSMSSMRSKLVQAGRFVGFEDGSLRPSEGTDYTVLGPERASESKVPVNDPWGNPYQVRFLLDKKAYVLRSLGPDGVEGACLGDEPDADDLCLLLAGR
jgi:serine/threonine protein kinase